MEIEGLIDLDLLRQQVGNHQEKLEEHEKLIKGLIEGHDDVNQKLQLMEKNHLEVKDVIYRENRDTRETTKRLIDLVEQMTGHKQASTALEYDYKKTVLDVKDRRSARFWEWFGKIAGAGGLLTIIIGGLIQLVQFITQ